MSVRQIMNVRTTDAKMYMTRKLIIIPQNGTLFSKMTAEPYKSFLKNIYHHLNNIY